MTLEAPAAAPPLPARRLALPLPRLSEELRGSLVAALVAFAVYELSRKPGFVVHNTYVLLADAFRHGQVNLLQAPPWLELADFRGKWYAPQAPLPAVLLLPFVAIWGTGFNLVHFSALAGAAAAGMAWSLASALGLTGWRRLAAWSLFAFGTTVWYESKEGGTWGVGYLVASIFLLGAIREWYGSRRLWLVGLLVGLAGLCRTPAMLALGGFALAVRLRPRDLLRLGLGVALPAAAMVGYNYVRYGTVSDLSLQILYDKDPYRAVKPYGMLNVRYVPFNLYSWFFMAPAFQDSFPWLRPTIMGTSLPLTSPALVAALGARRDRWLWACAALAVLPALLFYGNGFSQFGMRHTLEALPFVFALVCLALADDRAPAFGALVFVSVALNAYGVAFTNVFGLKP